MVNGGGVLVRANLVPILGEYRIHLARPVSFWGGEVFPEGG